MSLWWTAYVASSPQGGSKTQIDHFSSKSVLLLKEVCCKVSLYGNFQRQSCKAFTSLSSCAQIVDGDVPFYLKFSTKVTWPTPSKTVIFNLYSLVSRHSKNLAKKSSTMTNRKSTTSFPMSLRWTSYAASNLPPPKKKRGQKRKMTYSRTKVDFFRRVCYKVSLCENCQRQSCHAFTGLSNGCLWGRPTERKFCA